MDVLEDVGVDPSKVIIDHNNEETVKAVLDRGYWAAFTIYPHTKLGNQRMVEIMMEYGAERIVDRQRGRLGHQRSARRAEDSGTDERPRHHPRADRAGDLFNPLAAYGQSGQVQRGPTGPAAPASTRPRFSKAIPSCAAGRMWRRRCGEIS
jgi:uncharacterized protein